MAKKQTPKTKVTNTNPEPAAPVGKCRAAELGHRSCKCGRVGCGGVRAV